MAAERATQLEWLLLAAVAFVVPVALALAGRSWLVLAPLAAVPFAVPVWRTVQGFTERRQLNLALKGTARLALLVAVLFAAGLAAGAR